MGPLTAADDDEESGALDDPDFNVDFSGMDYGSPGDFAVGAMGSGMSPNDIAGVYTQAADLLKQQRRGLSGREKLGALLVGFGQPTRSGHWQEAVGNASQLLLQQTLAQRAKDDERRQQLANMLLRGKIADSQNARALEVARIKAQGSGAATGKLDADQKKRLGYVQLQNPEMPIEEAIKHLYDPHIDYMMMRPGIISSAASGGFDPRAALESTEAAIGGGVPPAAVTAAGPPAGMTAETAFAQAAEAIANGAPRAQVIARLKAWGFPTEGL